MRESYKKLTAFTLSEVLITLGIIGVVSTLTLPNLTNSYRRNVAMTKIEKGYAQIAQAYEQMLDNGGDAAAGEYSYTKDDDGNVLTGGQNGQNYFESHWRQYLKSPIYCDTYQDCGYSTEKPFRKRDNTSDSMSVVLPVKRATFMTNEGIVYIVNVVNTIGDANENETTRMTLFMDINGGKGPNVYGQDVFKFIRTENDGLMPFGYNLDLTKEDYRKECYGESTGENSTGKGEYCAEFLRRNGWEAPRDYKF